MVSVGDDRQVAGVTQGLAQPLAPGEVQLTNLSPSVRVSFRLLVYLICSPPLSAFPPSFYYCHAPPLLFPLCLYCNYGGRPP